MTNSDICDLVKNTVTKTPWAADIMVENGHGQNSGGYIETLGKRTAQKEHFLSYYEGKEKITYAYLRCPQLIIFIAEFAGSKDVSEAVKIVEKYDEKYNREFGSNRDGNYMWGKPEFRELRNTLQFGKICNILKNADSIKQVREEVGKLE